MVTIDTLYIAVRLIIPVDEDFKLQTFNRETNTN